MIELSLSTRVEPVEMLRHCLTVVTCLAWLWIPSHTTMAQQPEAIAEVDAQEVYLGDSFHYSVTVQNAPEASMSELQSTQQADFKFLGEQTHGSQFITNINGVVTQVDMRGKTFIYRVTPKVPGAFEIPPAEVQVDGNSIKSKQLSVRVIAPDDQDFVTMETAVEPPEFYPTQKFKVTLTVAVKPLPGELADTDPLTVQHDPPRLSVSWLGDDGIPNSLAPTLEWQQVLQPWLARRGTGFSINSIRSNSIFSLFEDSSLAFHPTPSRETRQTADGSGKEYWIYRFDREFTCSESGSFELPSATVKGNFGASMLNGRLQGKSIFAVSPITKLSCKEIPFDGRPADYIGAIGHFTLVSELTPTEAHVGDPLTLVLTLRGDGALEGARPPALEKMEELTKDFKVYQGSTQTKENAKQFTYSLRPLNSDVKQLPPIPVSYFDVDREQFVTLESGPVELHIRPSEGLESAEQLLGSRATDASPANDTNHSLASRQLTDDSLRLNRWVWLWSGLVTAFIATNMVITLQRHAGKLTFRRRGQGGLAGALRMLAAAKQTLPMESSTEHWTAIRQSIYAVVADRLDKSTDGMTTEELLRLLTDYRLSGEAISETEHILRGLDAAKFGSHTQASATLIAATERLLPELHQQLSRRCGSAHNMTVVGTLLLPLLSFMGGCAPSLPTAQIERFEQAELQFTQSKNAEEYFRAALALQSLVDDGVQSAALQARLGDAWFRAGELGRAVAAYQSSLQMRPRDSQVQTALAEVRQAADQLSQPPIHGFSGRVCYVIRWISLRELLFVTTFLTGILFALITAARFQRRWVGSAWAVGIPTVLLLAVAYLQWDWQYHTVHGVVVSGPVALRTGPADDFALEPAGKLKPGAEFIVLQRRENWLKVQTPDQAKGWLKDSAATLF